MGRPGLLLVAALLVAPLPARAAGSKPGKSAAAAKAFSLYLPAGVWKKLGITPKLTPGVWVSYQEARANANPSRMRVSVIPRLPHQFPHHHLLEFRITQPTGTQAWVKMLINGGLGHAGNIDRLMMAQTGVPAIEVPILGKHHGHGHLTVSQVGGRGRPLTGANIVVKHLGHETITVPAGRFRTRHLRVYQRRGKQKVLIADLWLDGAKVPLWGLVKSVTPKGITLELEAKGTGAKTDLPPFKPVKKQSKKRHRGQGAIGRHGAKAHQRQATAPGEGPAGPVKLKPYQGKGSESTK